MIVNTIDYEVIITDYELFCGVVHLRDNKIGKVSMYNVNLSSRYCDCFHYQQSGVPCYHAIALMREIGHIKKRNVHFNKNHFYDFCYNDRLQEMFTYRHNPNSINTHNSSVGTNSPFGLVFPTAESVESVVKSYGDGYKGVLPVVKCIEKNDKSITSSSRYASRGESVKGKKVVTLKKRITCHTCKKIISIRTRHPPSACLKHIAMLDKKLKVVNDIQNRDSDMSDRDDIKRMKNRKSDFITPLQTI